MRLADNILNPASTVEGGRLYCINSEQKDHVVVTHLQHSTEIRGDGPFLAHGITVIDARGGPDPWGVWGDRGTGAGAWGSTAPNLEHYHGNYKAARKGGLVFLVKPTLPAGLDRHPLNGRFMSPLPV